MEVGGSPFARLLGEKGLVGFHQLTGTCYGHSLRLREIEELTRALTLDSVPGDSDPGL